MASTPEEKKETFLNQIKPRANGHNFAGHQLPTFLDVTCRVRLHTLLHVVAQSKFKTIQTFLSTTPNIRLFCDPRNVGQQC